MDRAAVLRALHVTGAVLLLGNVIVTGFWATLLYRARARVPFRSVARLILWADLVFTLGGGVLLTVTGILLVRAGGYSINQTPWLVRGIGALVLATLLWLVLLLPDQWRLERLDPADSVAIRHVFLRWSGIGWGATAVLLYGLWCMVTKAA
jgi:uncharacterized membrane protein